MSNGHYVLVRMIKDASPDMRKGITVLVDKELASSLILDGFAERVHQDIHNYNTRPGPKGETR